MDKCSNRTVFFHEIKNIRVKKCVLPKIMTISTDLAISNSSMSRFVSKYWLNWQILVAISNKFIDKDGTTKVYIQVHSFRMTL